MRQIGVTINFVLLVLNLLPIPPLDGSRVVTSFLSQRVGYYYNKLEPYGFFIIIGLLILGALSIILNPPINWLQSTLYSLLGLT